MWYSTNQCTSHCPGVNLLLTVSALQQTMHGCASDFLCFRPGTCWWRSALPCDARQLQISGPEKTPAFRFSESPRWANKHICRPTMLHNPNLAEKSRGAKPNESNPPCSSSVVAKSTSAALTSHDFKIWSNSCLLRFPVTSSRSSSRPCIFTFANTSQAKWPIRTCGSRQMHRDRCQKQCSRSSLTRLKELHSWHSFIGHVLVQSCLRGDLGVVKM